MREECGAGDSGECIEGEWRFDPYRISSILYRPLHSPALRHSGSASPVERADGLSKVCLVLLCESSGPLTVDTQKVFVLSKTLNKQMNLRGKCIPRCAYMQNEQIIHQSLRGTLLGRGTGR